MGVLGSIRIGSSANDSNYNNINSNSNNGTSSTSPALARALQCVRGLASDMRAHELPGNTVYCLSVPCWPIFVVRSLLFCFVLFYCFSLLIFSIPFDTDVQAAGLGLQLALALMSGSVRTVVEIALHLLMLHSESPPAPLLGNNNNINSNSNNSNSSNNINTSVLSLPTYLYPVLERYLSGEPCYDIHLLSKMVSCNERKSLMLSSILRIDFFCHS